MTVKALTSLAVRDRALEWSVLHKGGDKQAHADIQHLEIDPGEGRRTILDGLTADHDRLVGEIRQHCGKLPAPLTLGIPASWVLLRIVELPAGSPDELKGMAELQIDKFSPFPVEESAISYELLAEDNDRCRVLLGAIRTDTVNLLADALREADLKPKRVDVNLLGWWRLLKDADKVHPVGSQVFVIREQGDCDIIVASAGIPVAVRSLSGLNELREDEADEDIARETVYTLASLDVVHSVGQAAELTVWHRGEAPSGLIEHFSDTYAMTAQPHSLDSLPPLAEGLTRRAEKAGTGTMDLAPVAWQEAATARRARLRMIVSSALVAGLWLGSMIFLFGGLQLKKKQIASLEKDLAALKAPAEKVRAIRDRAEDLRKYMDRSRSALECLREICDRMPGGVELNAFNYHKNKTLELTGVAETYAVLADFKKDLEQSELFTATDLPRTRHGARGEEFKIVCTLPGGGGTP